YYPTQVLVTGWDIIFFWVARMIMAGYEWSGDLIGTELSAAKGNFPFKDVYFTGMVRDNKRQKMSKSLGNSPDSLELMAKYGADGVRFGLLSSASAGNDIIFDAPFDNETKQIINESKLCEQGLNFCNKIWNALRLIKGWQVSEDIKDINQKEINTIAVKWFENKIAQKFEKYEENYKDYRLSEITVDLYSFIWDDFCGWYLEMIKPPFGESIDADSLEKTVQIFEQLMTMLHPIMPFVTEEVWHQLRDRVPGDNCIVGKKPELKPFDLHFIRQIDAVKEIITKVREVRNSKGVKMADQLPFFANPSPQNTDWLANEGIKNMLKKMANLSSIEITENEPEKCISIVSGADKYYVLLDIEIDIEAERERIEKELEYQRGFVASIEKKLSNERFVSGAPAAVVDKERQKMNDGLSRIGFLEDSLRNLK
ncbi:MAG TPA: class I tRNA ligase family protein, partial [Saprospiraceae bacterium]|nr:class I tRNA ligase family protein [Saprospiraceae bacterium]